MAQTDLRKVDVECGGLQRLMSHQGFDGQKIRTIFVKMGTKGMSKGMTSEPAWQTKTLFMGTDVLCEKGRSNGKVLISLAGEKELSGFAADMPVAG